MGHQVWSAPAVRCSYGQVTALGPVGERVKNVQIWRPQAEEGRVAGVLHTCWSRHCSLGALYGPLEGWLPALIAAGNPACWQTHVLYPFLHEVDAAMRSGSSREIEQLVDRLETVQSDDLFTLRCACWWQLALHHRVLQQAIMDLHLTIEGRRAINEFRGAEPDIENKLEDSRQNLLHKLNAWEDSARDYWRQLTLSDEDEYFAGRVAPLRAMLASQTVQDRLKESYAVC